MNLNVSTINTTVYRHAEITEDKPQIAHPADPQKPMTVDSITVGWNWSPTDGWHPLDVRLAGRPATDHAGHYNMAFTSLAGEWPTELHTLVKATKPVQMPIAGTFEVVV